MGGYTKFIQQQLLRLVICYVCFAFKSLFLFASEELGEAIAVNREKSCETFVNGKF